MRFFVLLIFIYACSSAPGPEAILERSIDAYGSDEFTKKVVSFDFRDKHYSVNRTRSDYVYTRSFNDSLGLVRDSLINSKQFSRTLNSNKVNLSEEWKIRYGNSVNSVLYFFQIPYVLKDPAVNAELINEVRINKEPYYAVKVTFRKSGGGDDFQDEYRYWVHKDTYFIDFLAYNYETDGGGTRFRQAINRKKVNGLTVQDYINYKPESKFPPLDSLPKMFERNELDELSRIYNENVEVSTTDTTS